MATRRRPATDTPTTSYHTREGASLTIGFTLNGQQYTAKNACNVLVSVFETLSKRDSTFLERFAALPKHGRKRRYLARNPDELYPGRPDLARECSAQLSSGWWLGTNVSRLQIKNIIEMACEVSGIKYGRELLANLGE